VSVERMLAEVWLGVVVGPASVYQAISSLRRLLKDTDPDPTYIATVPRKGYRLVAPVSQVAPPAAAALVVPTVTAVVAPAAAVEVSPPRRNRFASIAAGLMLVLLSLGGWFIWHRYIATAALTQSIVVIPFVAMTDQGQDQIFCDGLTEELSNWLAQIPALRVVARTSAFVYRGVHDARQIGRDLNTTHVLEGSMRRSGDHLRVSVQLIDARSGYQLWAHEYNQVLEDAIAVQEEIARSVAGNMQIRLTRDTTQKFDERRSDSAQAYNLYLQAMSYRAERTHVSNMRAMELYQQALAADPKFALAYVGLAYANINQRYMDARSVADIAAASEPLLNEALRLEPQLSELYAVRGALREEQIRTDEAKKDLLHAVALNPNDSWAFAELGRLSLGLGRPREAEENLSLALTLDPADFVLLARECIALQDMARYQEASSACERSRVHQADGDFGTMASSYLEWAQGHIPEALDWNAAAIKLDSTDINLYERRADLLLTLGLANSARETYQQARALTRNEEKTNLGLASVAYYEGGVAALQSHLAATRLDDTPHSRILFQVAYDHLLAGEPATAQQVLARAMAAPDFNASYLNDPWYARWGESDQLILALCELQTGQREAADRHLQEILTMLDQLTEAGVQRFGVYSLKAQVLALRGDPDGAMRALARATELGWRRSWWADHEPYFAQLRTRADFRALVARVDTANQQLRTQTQLLD
jgi:TolB-like protein